MASSEVTLVDTARLVHLFEELKPALPRSNSMRICVKNVMEGRVEGNFYTDEWPRFTTVVFQCLRPRLSDVADLNCYTTSKERLLYVLQKAELVDFHKWQLILVGEDKQESTTSYLVENLHSVGEDRNRVGLSDYFVIEQGDYTLLLKSTSIQGYTLGTSIQGYTLGTSIQGYTLGELTADHNDYITSQGQWFNFVGRETSLVQEYHKECIERLDTVAAFHEGDTTTPVAWQIRWLYSGSTGNLFTVEEHRRKGLGSLVKAEMCKKILAQGDLPECQIRHKNPNTELVQKLGFVENGIMNFIFLNTGCEPVTN